MGMRTCLSSPDSSGTRTRYSFLAQAIYEGRARELAWPRLTLPISQPSVWNSCGLAHPSYKPHRPAVHSSFLEFLFTTLELFMYIWHAAIMFWWHESKILLSWLLISYPKDIVISLIFLFKIWKQKYDFTEVCWCMYPKQLWSVTPHQY